MQQKCKREGCENLIEHKINKRYCNDAECIKIRQEGYYKKRVELKTKAVAAGSNNVNLKLTKRADLHGKMIKIHCCANGLNGRCSNEFYIRYNNTQHVYPKYCEQHRSSYRRARFESVKGAIC